jgi:hypothetical protein
MQIHTYYNLKFAQIVKTTSHIIKMKNHIFMFFKQFFFHQNMANF